MAKPKAVQPELWSEGKREEFWGRVQKGKPEECWPWVAYRNSEGYGSCRGVNGTTYPHRVAWALTHGEIAEGLTIDHLCETKACCNPGHMEPVPQGINVQRYYERRVEIFGKCACGGERKDGKTRRCRACHAAYQRRYRERNRERVLAVERASREKRRAG
jgi:hypothetical protein